MNKLRKTIGNAMAAVAATAVKALTGNPRAPDETGIPPFWRIPPRADLEKLTFPDLAALCAKFTLPAAGSAGQVRERLAAFASADAATAAVGTAIRCTSCHKAAVVEFRYAATGNTLVKCRHCGSRSIIHPRGGQADAPAASAPMAPPADGPADRFSRLERFDGPAGRHSRGPAAPAAAPAAALVDDGSPDQ